MRIQPSKNSNNEKNLKLQKDFKSIEQSTKGNANNDSNLAKESQKKDFSDVLDRIKNDSQQKTNNKQAEAKSNLVLNNIEKIQEKNIVSNDRDSLIKIKKDNQESEIEFNQNKQGFGDFSIKQSQNLNQIQYPSARAILHIADLERIISTIRSQNTDEYKQITINLKRSIFNGLELQLMIGKDKKIEAEFIASNQEIKNQLNARSDELKQILQNRGVKIKSLNLSVLSSSNSSDDLKESNNNDLTPALSTDTLKDNEIKTTQISDTSYRT